MNIQHPIFLFLFCCQISAFGQTTAQPQAPGFIFTYPDAARFTGTQIIQTDTGYLVACAMTGSTDSVGLYEWFTVTATLNNVGPEAAGQLWVHWPATVGAKHPSGASFAVSQGSFATHHGRMWNVGTLLPGESATLEVDFIRTDIAAVTLFAQVQNSQQADLDSTPGNATCCSPAEDDEAALTLVPILAPTPPDTPDSLAWMLGTGSGQPNVQVLESLEMEIAPNPAHTAAWVSFSLENEEIVDLFVMDVHEAILSQAIDNQIFTAGKHRMKIELDGLLTGVYFVALRTAEGVAVRRLVKT